jgi:hypothetical protein
MSADDDFERKHKERMEDAERGIKAFSAREDSEGIEKARQVLHTVVYPAFAECEAEDHHHVYQWRKRLIPGRLPLADGSDVYSDALGAELELTFRQNRPVKLTIMYRRPEQWLETVFSTGDQAPYSIGFSETTKAIVQAKVHLLMRLAHGT